MEIAAKLYVLYNICTYISYAHEERCQYKFLCHELLVPPCSSSIFTGDGEGGSGFAAAAAASAAAAAVGGGGGAFDFGVDPNLDPELALALRVSMEEERARQEAAMKRSAEESTAKGQQAGESSGVPDVAMSDAGPVEITDKTSDMIIVSSSCIMQCPVFLYNFHNAFLNVCIYF